MGEEFYAIIKLISGEEILSLISVDENDGDPIVILQNPVVMKMIPSPTGHYIKVKPWLEMCDEDIFVIRYDRIMTMSETTNERIIDVYEKYVNDEEDSIDIYRTSGEVKVSNTTGYISSVEEARKTLEKIYKDLKES